MKITDEGLAKILTLGQMTPTKTDGIFLLYKWKDTSYYCGLESLKQSFKESGVYISLSVEQFKMLSSSVPKAPSNKSSDLDLTPLLKTFDSVAAFKIENETSSLVPIKSLGKHENLNAFSIKLEKPSPFKIVQETLKHFHGTYSSLSPLSESLTEHGFDVSNLWMTLHPVLKDEKLEGILAGFSEKKKHNEAVLNSFKDFENILLKAS